MASEGPLDRSDAAPSCTLLRRTLITDRSFVVLPLAASSMERLHATPSSRSSQDSRFPAPASLPSVLSHYNLPCYSSIQRHFNHNRLWGLADKEVSGAAKTRCPYTMVLFCALYTWNVLSYQQHRSTSQHHCHSTIHYRWNRSNAIFRSQRQCAVDVSEQSQTRAQARPAAVAN